MGRIKTKLIKRKTYELLEKHGNELTTDFEKNKKLIVEFMEFPSKKIRNIIAGYITRLKKKEQA
ncbi:MAG: 30S ribosomal protein S17e [Candidatus Woesearchaeota archaeon]|nr:30S ribosomal protein S17e [Candidatus Woesearchaeota archaeon]